VSFICTLFCLGFSALCCMSVPYVPFLYLVASEIINIILIVIGGQHRESVTCLPMLVRPLLEFAIPDLSPHYKYRIFLTKSTLYKVFCSDNIRNQRLSLPSLKKSIRFEILNGDVLFMICFLFSLQDTTWTSWCVVVVVIALNLLSLSWCLEIF